MKHKSVYTCWAVGLLVILSVLVLLSTDFGTLKAKGAVPTLSEEWVYEEGSNVVFDVVYTDVDGDEGTVHLYLDDQPFEMTPDPYTEPLTGQYFDVYIVGTSIDDNTEFYFYAEDSTGNDTYLDNNGYVFLVGDYLGWGEKPNLSNPTVRNDESSHVYVFNVDYQDPDGDGGYILLNLFNETDMDIYEMDPTTGNPRDGQEFEVSIPESDVGEDWTFYIETWDANGSYNSLYDTGGNNFIVRNVLVSDGSTNGGGDTNGDVNGNDNGDGNGGTPIWAGWFDNPEVVVGIVGLVAIGCGSAFGLYRRKKKHGRFSELLTKLDQIYGSYKLNPQRCETELERMKSTINEDLKRSTIDENNYSILKTRIDEILAEIRSQAMKTQVSELPKDIELKIKDMLIDGKLTREEYDKILPVIKGSDMATDDKEKMKKMVESWVKEDKQG
ncbi:MAG: hypothetical protein JSV56_02780 [Methanomassiliicoccales archaeon]|nr:MAG: hypothetical protein JSV56_02780 [Methanomassiliicoccales archaeon]